MVRTVARTYTTRSGDEVTSNVLIIPAVVKAVPTLVRKNTHGTPWILAQADITYPDGSVKTVAAQLFEKSRDMYPDSFAVGEEIELEVQTEGDGAGMAKMQLPGLEKVDFAAFIAEAVTEEA